MIAGKNMPRFTWIVLPATGFDSQPQTQSRATHTVYSLLMKKATTFLQEWLSFLQIFLHINQIGTTL